MTGMSYSEAVVTKPVADLYARTSVRSPRVTQAILGTPLIVNKENKNWLWVTMPDAYRGWIEATATKRLKEGEPRYASTSSIALVTSNISVVYLERSEKGGESLPITIGTRLELVAEQSHRLRVRLPDKGLGWVRKKETQIREANFRYPLATRQKVLETAKRFLNVPYLWGGTTPLGFDCSGLVQLTHRLNGIELPRDADQQFAVSRPVEVRELEPADLLFFSTKGRGITHVGIFSGDGSFLHASGKEKEVTVTPFKDRYYQSILVSPGRVWPTG